ncbi:hypothetical protein ACS0TY_014652 [Phlomoides rotata]
MDTVLKGKPTRRLGPILDVEFTFDGKHLITSSDVSKSNLSENSIIVWDVSRQVPLSNQVYTEAYTCPCIRCHPFEPYFIAQSNANYIAIFCTRAPFKLDKYKRYESHGVSGFPIKCNFSLDGTMIASGSSDGCIYFYNSKTSKLFKKIKAGDSKVAFYENFAGKWLGSRQIRCNWAPKGAGTSDDKQGSDSKSVVELIDGSSG